MGGTQIFDILRQAMLPAILAWGVAFACKLGLWHFAAGANVVTGVFIGAVTVQSAAKASIWLSSDHFSDRRKK